VATGRRHAIIAPSIPGQNRLMRGGTIYVSGLTLPTADKDGEAELPKSAHLPDLLVGAGAMTIHMSLAGHRPTLASGPGLHAYVTDAGSEVDLDTLAQFVIQRPLDVLPVGASGLGRALARAVGDGAAPSRPPDVSAGLLLYVVGSRRQASVEQIAALLAEGAEEIAIPVGADDDVSAIIKRFGVPRAASLLVIRPESIQSAGVPPLQIAGRLGRAAAAVVQRLRPSAIVMAGGDTAAACLAALEAESLHVHGELNDGVAFGSIFSNAGVMPFFTKSGSFGQRNTWTLLAEQLRRARS